MATITTTAYNDAAARTAGEAMTINSGAVWTIRTDTRVHANAPASNLGSLGSVTINEGELVWDSTNIRWMPFGSGTGNVPAVGTTISQGGVSGYLLGVWAAINVAQTAVGAAMPTSGFIKFREVTNGPFSAGALSGIGASATGPDVQGWMEIVHDAASNFTIPRLGKHTVRGGRFFLDNTNGTRGQDFQIPTMGSASQNSPGMYVETGVGTDQYEFWPALDGADGWASMHIGDGENDVRQKFVRCLAGGIMRMGETVTSASLAYTTGTQASTYAEISQASAYTWVNNEIEVYYSAGAHQLETGQQVGLVFTTGGAVGNNGIYTITAVTSPFAYKVALTGSGTPGNVTARPGITVTFTAHGKNVGTPVYCDFTSGTGVDGTYEVYAVISANAYLIKYPSITATTSGNATVSSYMAITWTAHGFAVGQRFYINFTSGGAVGNNGVYVTPYVATNTIYIHYPTSTALSGNCELTRYLGYVAPAGCRTWIPSNILTECATGARATNTAPNSTIATRPEWTTTSAGALDLEYICATSGYLNSSQAYSVRIRECAFMDSSVISECATALDIDGFHHGMRGALDVLTVSLANNYAGGSVKNVKAHRGNTPGTSDHAISITYCKGITFENIEAGIVQYARSTGYPIHVGISSNCTFNWCRTINGRLNLSGSPDITINNQDYCERFNGYGLAAETSVVADANCNNLKVDNVTYGFNFTIPNQQPNRLLNTTGCSNVKLRNCGTKATPLPSPTWAKNLTTMAYLYQSGGSNNGVKIQKVFAEGVRTAPFATVNSDKNMLYESFGCGQYVWSTKTLLSLQYADLNGTIKNSEGANGTTGQASVYGTHWVDVFLGSDYGRLVLMCNEPTVETTPYFSSLVGTPKWNSSGGVIIPNVNDSHVWETPHFIKGHTGFLKRILTMSGGTLSNHDIFYQIDTGSGYSEWRNAYYRRQGGSGSSGQYTFTVTDATGVAVGDYCFATGLDNIGQNQTAALVPMVTQVNGNTITVDRPNSGNISATIEFTRLPSEVIDPAIGFKLKLKISTITANTAAITFLRLDTKTTPAAQDNYYPLDTNTFSLTNLPSGVEVRIRQGSKTLEQVQSITSGNYSFVHALAGKKIKAQFTLPGYVFEDIEWVLTDSNVSLPITYSPDPSYLS